MLTEEPKLASFCLTEPDAGSDVSGMRTTAVKKGDKWVINGTKCFITNGSHASWYTTTQDRQGSHPGISAFVVPRDAGVVVDKKEDKLGQRASDTAMISFNDVEIPADLLGEENKGFKLAMMTLDRTRPGVSAMAVGIAQAAFEYARDYSRSACSSAFRSPCTQAIQFMIADMATKIEAARLLVLEVGCAARPGRAQYALAAGSPIRGGHRHGGDRRRRAGLRRVRVHQGVPGREADARRGSCSSTRAQIQRLVIAREVLMPRRVEEPAAAAA